MWKYISKFIYIFPSNPVILIPWFLTFISVSFLEVFGIGLIGPFIQLANNPDIVSNNAYLLFLYNQLGFTEVNNFIVVLGVSIIILFSVKSIIAWYSQSKIFKFSYIQKEKLIARLMHGYIEAPYTLYLTKNSAQVIQNVINQTRIFSDSVLSTLLTTSSNSINIIIISIFLCVVSPVAVGALLLIAIPLFLLFNSFKGKMHIWGKELHDSSQEIIRSINHGLGGFKETRILGCGEYFEAEAIQQARRFANASIGFYSFKLSPRFMVETILVVFLVGFVSIFLLLNQDIQKLTSTLSILSFASIRLIPAFTNFTNGLGVLRNSSYALNQLYSDLKELETIDLDRQDQHNSQEDKKISFTQEIVLDQVTYRYPSASDNSLTGLSLNIPKDKSIALIGKSGAGKTTLVDVILGLLTPQAGDITVDGVSIYNNLRSWQNMIGYIPQSIFLIDDTIERNIAFGIPDHLINPEKLNKAIQTAQLAEVVANLPHGVKTRVGERGVMLSGGQRQRVGIARALYHEREILVLDEATSALDNETEHLVTEAIKSLSGTKTMIIIAHRLSTVEHCDCIYMLEKGQIVKSGNYQEVVLGNE
ncbi:MAG: ABC transporter ATP-binding protein [Nostocaceae cyanobacterium]|nr:ABC transporter ATP-binding protein [Nostocaceae cyanobacterium]